MLNQITIQGRLTAEPELRTTGTGLSVVTITVAVPRDYSRNDEVDFIDVVAWRERAEFIDKYFSKGKMILVSGSLQTRTYEDKDGKKRKAYEVIANNVYFADSKKEPKETESTEIYRPIEDDEDLPF